MSNYTILAINPKGKGADSIYSDPSYGIKITKNNPQKVNLGKIRAKDRRKKINAAITSGWLLEIDEAKYNAIKAEAKKNQEKGALLVAKGKSPSTINKATVEETTDDAPMTEAGLKKLSLKDLKALAEKDNELSGDETKKELINLLLADPDEEEEGEEEEEEEEE